MEGFLPEKESFATKAIHSGHTPDQWDSKCAVPPVVMSSIFKMEGAGYMDEDGPTYFYGRYNNPTRTVLEKTFAAIEGAKHGFAFPSGLAAVSALHSILRPGDHMVSMTNIYSGAHKFFSDAQKAHDVQVTFVGSPLTPQKIKAAMTPKTKLVWLETPTNPLLEVVDIQEVARVVKKESKVVLAVDNTFLTPYFQRPMEHGADVAVYSCTKYMNGHTDIIMGAVTTNDDNLARVLKDVQKHQGSVPSPFDCFLVHRGLKTLHLRMNEHMKNGLVVARFLQGHPSVEKVLHPGLPNHPGHSLAKKQTSGHSGMVSFYIKGGVEQVTKFLTSLKIFLVAPSLGTDISLASFPAKLSHYYLSQKERDELRITDNLIRLHVGLETAQDLIDDLDQALKKATC